MSTNRNLLKVVAGAALVAAVSASDPAAAASFPVTSLDDYPIDTGATPLGSCLCASTEPNSGACTIRAAIQASNACPDAIDTIDLNATGTYRLSIPGSGEDSAAAGDWDLIRDPNFGSGPKSVIINMKGQTIQQFIWVQIPTCVVNAGTCRHAASLVLAS